LIGLDEELEGVLFDVVVGITYIVTEKTVRGGATVNKEYGASEGTAECPLVATTSIDEDLKIWMFG
jgi:hypothetical protein